MNNIYITKQSKQKLINNIHDWFNINNFLKKDEIKLVKKYPKICKQLSILPLISDLLNIIKQYINDQIIIEYEYNIKHIDYDKNGDGESPTDDEEGYNYEKKYIHHALQFSIKLKSKNVYINYKKYTFEYKLHVIYDLNYRITGCMLYYPYFPCSLEHIKNNAYILIDNNNEYYNCYSHDTRHDFIKLFNNYMKAVYKHTQYVKIHDKYSKLDNNSNNWNNAKSKYTLYGYSPDGIDPLNVRITDHIKMKNIIVIMKIIIEIITNTFVEYLYPRKKKYICKLMNNINITEYY